jgi:uncharacterized protein
VTTYHELTPAQFAALAGGGGGPAAIGALRRAQLSKHLLVIAYLLGHWPGPAAERDAVAATLDRARAADPDAFAEVLGAPLVGAWAAIAARAHRQGVTDWANFGHLGSLAVLACAAGGVDGDADVPVRDGWAVLPGLGALALPDTAPADVDRARLASTAGRLILRVDRATREVPADTAVEAPHWQPVRHLFGPSGLPAVRLGLDDLHPYRHGHHAPPAARLGADDLDRWRVLFGDAWRLLAQRLPERAGELRAGLRTLVPLAQTDSRAARSATIRHAFGVFGLTRPPDPAEFAVTLVHEFQHSKLSAVLDLTPLSDPADERRYFAPWRTDPRPLGGLIQGVYAFVGVADTWRALRDVPDVPAQSRFAAARLQVDRGLTAVEHSGALTPAGEALAAQLRRTTDELLAEPVPAATARAAEQALDEIRQGWQARNRIPA